MHNLRPHDIDKYFRRRCVHVFSEQPASSEDVVAKIESLREDTFMFWQFAMSVKYMEQTNRP